MGEINKKLLRKLFRNYRRIRKSCDEQIMERYRQGEEFYESFEWFVRLMEGKDPDKPIEDLQRTSENTERIIVHIEKAVEIYGCRVKEEDCLSQRRYEIMYMMYFSKNQFNAKDIAKYYDLTKSTVYRDLEEAEDRLSMLLSVGSHREPFSYCT